MSLPKNVQRQLDAAEALQQQAAQAPGVEVVTDPSQLLAPAPAAPAVAPTASPAPEPAPTPQPAPTPAPGENWEARYRSMKGRYDTEVPDLQAREKALSSRVTQLTEQVQALAKATTKPEPAAVDPRDAQQFGEDMVEMVQRNARQIHDALRTEFGQLTGQFETRIKALEDRVVGVAKRTEQTLEDTFYSTLESQVPDWKEVNASQAWLKWLGETDPVYGLPRQAALDVAFQRQDAPRVVNIFKEFRSAQKGKVPPSLESQVAPASGGSAAPNTASPAPKPMLSQKFLTTFYADVAKGRYANKLEEQQRIENEINLAAREGRIV